MSDVKKQKKEGDIKQLTNEIKEYIDLQTSIAQVTFVEKLTKIISLIIIAGVISALLIGLLFYLLFALAYVLIPIVGEIISFVIIGGVFLLLIALLLIFKKSIVINPILRAVVKALGNKLDKKRWEE